MADRLTVDLVLLESISDRLRRSGEALRAAGAGRLRAAPDAGEATPIFAELLAQLSESSTGLAAGLHDAGMRVSEAGQTYAYEDTAAGQRIIEVL
ncbi:hypothetical protein FB565_008230 [Actinoplanes lutulentus]|uniref:Excreted virulence factor EspC (Type VII ESX diderm) n=1 Tax=Actinoplanes lutulentus TaxID=1287878 RepID=A0A327ZDQ9_9ACTN|nr:hypothetical protein [Actinoplanes lutulentus]MBB2948447.1 hypothetical protein [Actinoplanes lutulentus]RAK34520.1 hypothetical protein B0I29_111119 [Actinoplanes lutulentus]